MEYVANLEACLKFRIRFVKFFYLLGKDPESFCLVCCDNEFGVNKQDSRANCKVECIKYEKNKNNETVLESKWT